MSYQEEEEESQTFYYFSSTESKIIEDKLTELGYTWGHNKVCGNCCSMFADKYYVNGIMGKFKNEDREKMFILLKEKGISCSIYGNTICANPKYGSYYDDYVSIE